ncbi:cobalt transporter CbiM [bacterium]|nr:cobalt transporter CbiM [bacterium]
MHIADGVLSEPVLVVGGVLAVAGVAMGLRRMDYERIPRVGVLASVFFVASLIHVKIGPSSAHLILNGLTGLVLGWAAVPALLVGLVLQLMFFGFGGVSALGVNVVVMAAPAVVCYLLFGRAMRSTSLRTGTVGILAFAAGALGVALSAALAVAALLTTGREFAGVVVLVFGAHIPVMIIEGLVVTHVVLFLRKVRPELLEAPVT